MPYRRPWPLAARVASGVVAAVVGLIGLLLVVHSQDDVSAPRDGELVDRASSADGRYEVHVLNWKAYLDEDGWDVVVHGPDGNEAYAGCLYSKSNGHYEHIESVDARSVRLATAEGPVTISFDPDSMKVTSRIPAALCGGFDEPSRYT
ncbi:hypothetical protein ACQPZJ_42685 [Actinoplanes sp. CA-054009]